MDQPRAAQYRHVIAGITGHARRRGGHVGHSARVAGQAGALHIDQVGHRLQGHPVQDFQAPLTRRDNSGSVTRTASQSDARSRPSSSSGAREQNRSTTAGSNWGARCLRATATAASTPRRRATTSTGQPAAAARAGESPPPAGGRDSPCRPGCASPCLIATQTASSKPICSANWEPSVQCVVRRRNTCFIPATGNAAGHQGAGHAAAVRADPPHHERDHPRRAHVEQIRTCRSSC